MKLLLVVSLLLAQPPDPDWHYSTSEFSTLGFSQDGKLFAVALFGRHCVDMDGPGPYCRTDSTKVRIKVLSTATGKVVKTLETTGGPAVDRSINSFDILGEMGRAKPGWSSGDDAGVKGDKTVERALAAAQTYLAGEGISLKHVAEQSAPDMYRRTAELSLGKNRYRLRSEPTAGPTADCDHANELLDLHVDQLAPKKATKVLKQDTKLAGWRACAAGYFIDSYSVYSGSGPPAAAVVIGVQKYPQDTQRLGLMLSASRLPE